MKQKILYIASFLGNSANLLHAYTRYLMNKFFNNELSQLKTVIIILSFLIIFYSYLSFTNSGLFSYFYIFSSFTFCVLILMFLGLHIHKTNPNLKFELFKYSFINNNSLFQQQKVLSPFLNKKRIEHPNKFIKSKKDFNTFYEAVISTSIFNKNINCFNVDGFKDEYPNLEKTTSVTELRSIYYLIIFYNHEYLCQNINSETKNKQFEVFKKYFTPRFRGEICKFNSSSWNGFYETYFPNHKKSNFYIQLSKELKNILK